MTTAPASPTVPTHPWLAAMARNRPVVSYVLFGLAAALAGVSIWLGVDTGRPLWPIWVCGGGLALVFLVAGLWLLLTKIEEADALNTLRIFVLVVGGLTGLLLAFMAVLLANPLATIVKDSPLWKEPTWWTDLLLWAKAGGPDPNLDPAIRSKAGWHVLIMTGALLGGLLIMLLSLQLGQTDIRTNPAIRRLLYGYNALLTGVLLLAILGVANVFASAKFAKPLDFTASNIYSISPRTQGFLANLERPVTVYAIFAPERMSETPDLDEYVRTMLSNCQDTSANFHWEEVDSDAKDNEVKRKYPAREFGLLVEYEMADGTKEYKMIPQDDLGRPETSRDDQDPNAKRKLQFTGEDALMSALNALSEPKKPIIYFTQGAGELTLDSDENPVIREGRQGRPNLTGGGRLRSRLEKRNFDIRPFDPSPLGEDLKDKKELMRQKAEILWTADVLVVAGPRRPLSPSAVLFLTEFMNRRGKLVGQAQGSDGKDYYGFPGEQIKDSKGKSIQLEGKKIEKDGKMLVMGAVELEMEGPVRETGLEPLLAQYNIQMPPRYLIGDPRGRSDPSFVVAEVKSGPEQENFLANNFKGKRFPMVVPRPVLVRQSGPPGMSPVKAEALLACVPEQPVLFQNQIPPAVDLLAQQMARNPPLAEKLLSEARGTTVAVAASDAGGMPQIPGHPPTGGGPQKPRLVVIGSSALVSNYLIEQGGFRVNFDFFASALDWLRDQPRGMGIDAKAVPTYSLPTTASTNYWTFVLLPAALISLTVVGTGTGVWLVRRR